MQQRAERLFLLKSHSLEQMPKQHLAKPAGGGGGEATGAANGAAGGMGGARATALLEEQISRLGELLGDTLEETATMVEKKQARTYEELERDLAAAAECTDTERNFPVKVSDLKAAYKS